jgi:hypothetical protein
MTLVRAKTFAWTAGVAASVALGLGYIQSRAAFFSAYLQGFLLCLGMALGSMIIWMVHSLLGGRWGEPIERIFRGAVRTLPLVVVFFLPILAGISDLYSWTNSDLVKHDEILLAKQWYLNRPFFVGRAIFFLTVWVILAQGLKRRAAEAVGKKPGSPAVRRLQKWCAVGIPAYGLTITFAAIDWVMSLEPHYMSTIFGLLIGVGQFLGGFAFAVAVALLFPGEAAPDEIESQKLVDLGNLLLMAVMLWAYLSYSQYLVNWAGQIATEVLWYNLRTGWWQWLGAWLIVGNFALPFVFLLFRRIKKDRRWMLAVTLWLIISRYFDIVWLVRPNFSPTVVWLDAVAPVALGGLWFGAFLWILERTVPVEGKVDA